MFFTSPSVMSFFKSIIVPVSKSSHIDPKVPVNYRGISLFSCIYKVYSGIINVRIVKYLEDLDWFVDGQGGFRKWRSCQDQRFSLASIICNREPQNLFTFAAFVDMQKAFDWVDRDLFILKLLINNIDGKVYDAIKAMYSNTIAIIRINGFETHLFSCKSGVRQGDVLSTTLFLSV